MSTLHTSNRAGIPLHYDHIGGEMNPISIELLVMAGSADDGRVGAPGMMHWFEHVPFRGTTLFPQGHIELSPGFSRNGGSLNAYTSFAITNYHALVPKEYFKQALAAIVDLAARPLLRDEDVHAERTIIKEEIRQSLSSIGGYASNALPKMLWGDSHPYGHAILGSPETLDSMTAEDLRNAHTQMYTKSTMQLFISGGLSPDAVREAVEEASTVIPIGSESRRHTPVAYGALHTWTPTIERIHTTFDTTQIYALFPLTAEMWRANGSNIFEAAAGLLSTGGLSGPLLRTLREERHLCYQANPTMHITPDGGYVGMVAKCDKKNVDALIQGFKDVLALPELRSQERWEFCVENREGMYAMRVPHPATHSSNLIDSLMETGVVLDQNSQDALARSVTHEQALIALDNMSMDRARIIVFEGK